MKKLSNKKMKKHHKPRNNRNYKNRRNSRNQRKNKVLKGQRHGRRYNNKRKPVEKVQTRNKRMLGLAFKLHDTTKNKTHEAHGMKGYDDYTTDYTEEYGPSEMYDYYGDDNADYYEDTYVTYDDTYDTYGYPDEKYSAHGDSWNDHQDEWRGDSWSNDNLGNDDWSNNNHHSLSHKTPNSRQMKQRPYIKRN